MPKSQHLSIDQAIDLAQRKVNQGNVPKALELYKAVLQHQPNHPLAKEGLRKLQGKVMEDQSSQLNQINPSHDQLNTLISLYNSNQMVKAERACKELLQSYPTSLIILNVLGNALQWQGKLQEAVQSYTKAIQLKPDYAEAYSNRGLALQSQNKLQEAIQSYTKAIQLKPDYAEAYNNRGLAFKYLRQFDESLKDYEQAIKFKQGYGEAYCNLAGLFVEMGQIKEAIAKFKKAISLKPDYAEAYYYLSTITKYDEYDETIRDMESLYDREDTSSKQREHLAFALGKAFEDLDEHNKSFEYILEGNRLKRATYHYKIARDVKRFNKLKEIFSSSFFSSHTKTGNSDETPIFILGMPRSGTTLVEQILASHSQVFGAGELNDLLRIATSIHAEKTDKEFPDCILDLNEEALETLGVSYLERLRKHSDSKRFITDKMPHNFWFIGLIKIILPEAKVVHCIRDPRDNCLSIFKNSFVHANYYAYDLKELGQYYNLYLDLMDHWEKTIPDFIYDLSYEAMVSNQEEETRKLLTYCQLPWEASCLSFHKTERSVATASSTQVRRPIYNDSVSLWKKYERQLEPLRNALGQ